MVICILSGIVLPKWAHSPLTWLRKVEWQKRRIAEYGQVIEQLIFPGKPNISPFMTFAPPVGVDELRRESPGRPASAGGSSGAAKSLLVEHLAWIHAQDREGLHGR